MGHGPGPSLSGPVRLRQKDVHPFRSEFHVNIEELSVHVTLRYMWMLFSPRKASKASPHVS